MNRTLLALAFLFTGLCLCPAANLTGLWEFDNALNSAEASVGNDLVFEGIAPAHSASADDDALTTMTGVITTAAPDNANRIRADHDIAPNGGGAFVNQYSIVADIFSPVGSRDSWRTIFQTSATNANDGEYFIRPDNDQVGVGDLTYSSGPIAEGIWTRLVITIDLTLSGNDALTYFDGALHYTHPSNPGADARFALDTFLYFFTDENGDNAPLQVAALAIFDGILTGSEVATLGAAGDPITNPPPPVDPPVVAAQPAGPANAEAGTSEDFEFLATDPNGEDVEIQVEWGNGVSSAWTAAGPSGVAQTIPYVYPGAGTFNIRARARDSGGAVSDFVEIQSITVVAAPAGPLVLAGLWEFDNPGNPAEATVGNDLVFEGEAPAHAAALADDGGTSLKGVITTATPDNANRIRCDHGIPANGGGTFVNRYTILADIFSPPASRASWRTIYQTNTGNSNDGDYFIRPDNDHVGVGELTYSDSAGPIDETSWTRLVITVDLSLTGGDALVYFDGALHYTHPSDVAIDGRFALDPFLYFFTDENGENAPLHVATLAIFDGVLTPEQVAEFGSAGDALGPGGPEVVVTDISYDGSTPGAETLSISWESADGKLYNLRSTLDPASDDPIDWPIFGGLQDLAATPPENTVIFPHPPEATRLFVVEEFDAPPVRIYFDDFESGQGAWTVASTGMAGTDWGFGTPGNVGPPAANSGANCFGTNLDANYAENAVVSLRSPVIDLTTAGGATLNWAQSRDIELMFDSGTVNVLDAADDSVIGVVQADIDDTIVGWENVSRAIPAAALGKMIKVEFLFASDDFQQFAGWYIDDVEVTVP